MRPHPATTQADFAALHALRQRMALWDIAMSAPLGLTAQDVLGAYYTGTAKDLHRAFTAPGACALLVRAPDGTPLASLGYARHQGDSSELQAFYVDESVRGQGLGRSLLTQVLARMAADGYRRACLETAPFMIAAIALYSAHGFARCPPFRAQPPSVAPSSLFMDRAL